jgi:hypothetical protein
LFVIVWSFYDQQMPPHWVLLLALFVYVFGASFEVWRRERLQVLSLRASPFTVARREELVVLLGGLLKNDRELFFEILRRGALPIPAPNAMPPHFQRILHEPPLGRFARLVGLGLVVDDGNNSYVVTPDIREDAKAIHPG